MINLVLVVQRFSPFDKVGARRWSKFVHYLQKKEDLNIHIITQNYYYPASNPWNIEIDKAKVRITYLNTLSGTINKYFPLFKRPLDFLQYRIFNHTDEGYAFSKKAFDHLKKERQNILPDVIIASSPAYSTCYFAAKYKAMFPQVKLINDYRDAWIDGYFSWNKAIDDTNPSYKKQMEMELFSVNNCDVVVSVTPELTDKFKNKIKNKNTTAVLITNGYDKRDHKAKELNYPSQFVKNKINICHFGTLDFGRDDEFIKFLETVIPDNIVFHLIGTVSEKLKIKCQNNKSVILTQQIKPDLLSSFLFYADFHLIINDLEFYYAYGSKVFDAMLYSKPIVFISKENSLVKKYKNSSGFFYSDNSAVSNKSLIEKIGQYEHVPTKLSTYPEFDIETLSNEYYDLIKSQANKT
jgi:hypothetical protein